MHITKGVGKKEEETNSKSQVPSDQKDRKLELESIVEIVVVDDDRGTQDDPYRDDGCG
jgi:hypothetical protein